eukprot:14313003-Alexandrium_andersonii.AAC.1
MHPADGETPHPANFEFRMYPDAKHLERHPANSQLITYRSTLRCQWHATAMGRPDSSGRP